MAKKIGALWLKMSKEGETFYSGVIQDLRGDIPIVVFQNNRKENEKQPDFNIVLSEGRKGTPPAEETEGDVAEEVHI